MVSEKEKSLDALLWSFKRPIGKGELPRRFTYPFDYEPHALALEAAEDLKSNLQGANDIAHNFGINAHADPGAVGKMFGVLVVELPNKEIRYLKAFSGKLGESNLQPGFVPPIFDMLHKEGFFLEGMRELNEINEKVKLLQDSDNYSRNKRELAALKDRANQHQQLIRELIKEARARRKTERQIAVSTKSGRELERVLAGLDYHSATHQYYYKDLRRYWKHRVQDATTKLTADARAIDELKLARKTKSSDLQEQLFAQYNFRNIKGEYENVKTIFADSYMERPPAGAGDCAAPKLLQFAFENGLRPVAMAEFWWGKSPQSEIRHHGQYYPACRGKCKPILAHMLAGVEMDSDPGLINPGAGKLLDTIYEDEHLLVVNKPAGLLSVPGKQIKDSVYLRIRKRYTNATGPLIVHRLDMSTSGLMLLAKSKNCHKQLQAQFGNRSVKKRYVALLNGTLNENEGQVSLPLRTDFDNRPRQLVCHQLGKAAITHWEKICEEEGKTRVYFYPVTGRTHQLRVHAAHSKGLNIPIYGDVLYGQKADRLHLHAERLSFVHPATDQEKTFQVPAEF